MNAPSPLSDTIPVDLKLRLVTRGGTVIGTYETHYDLERPEAATDVVEATFRFRVAGAPVPITAVLPVEVPEGGVVAVTQDVPVEPSTFEENELIRDSEGRAVGARKSVYPRKVMTRRF